MLRRTRETAPVLLVPLAWTAVAAAHVDLLGDEGVLIAHLVMAAFIAVFAVTGRAEMGTGALRAWWLVLVVGLGVTLLGVAGFLLPGDGTALFAASLVGWMLLPAVGMAYTARLIPAARAVYLGGAAVAVAGAALYLVALAGDGGPLELAALALVGVGQTAGIVDATRRG